MTSEAIEKYVESKSVVGKPVTISFKQRNNITGIFVEGHDYEDMKRKNFWRIVTESKIKDWQASKDSSLVRIFSGSDFTKIK